MPFIALAALPLALLISLPIFAEIAITRPLLILADDEGNPLDLPLSTSEVEAMEKASRLPDGAYKLIRPDATIVVNQGVDPLPDPVDPPLDPDPVPPDPNTPVNPPSDGEYPEAAVTYKPTYKPLGQYSIANVCEAFPREASVTLGDNETLDSAYTRLKAAASSSGVFTGAINVPYDVDTVQCDRFRFALNDDFHTLTIRGIPGPNDEQPRFYCRLSEELSGKSSGWLSGTLPTQAGELLFPQNDRSVGGDGKKRMANLMVENIHVDGYAQFAYSPLAANVRYRRNYFHHATSDGFTTPDISFYQTGQNSLNMEFCDNEIAYAGGGNTSHCLYLHRSERASFGEVIDIKFVDNTVHSCNYSSGFKSIANNNLLVGNKFYKFKTTDPGYLEPKSTQMLVDIPACSNSLTIENNYFEYNRVNEGWSAGNSMIGIRNRANMFGCDIPQPPFLKERVELSDGSNNQCYRDPTPPECAIPGSEFWDNSYWTTAAALPDKNVIKAYVTDNTFKVPLLTYNPDTGQDEATYKADVAVPIESWGTYPYYKPSLNNKVCTLEPYLEGDVAGYTGIDWYERSVVVMSGNTYENVNPNYNYLENNIFSNPPGLDDCGTEWTVGNPNTDSLFDVGSGETFRGETWQ